MRYIKLFENWDSNNKLVEKAAELLEIAAQDPEMSEYDLIIDQNSYTDYIFGGINSGVVFIQWINQDKNERWRESGYAEDYRRDAEGNFIGLNPMNALALVDIDGTLNAYLLTPEEKYFGKLILSGDDEDDDGDDEDEDDDDEYQKSQILPISGYEDFKNALMESIWEMDN